MVNYYRFYAQFIFIKVRWMRRKILLFYIKKCHYDSHSAHCTGELGRSSFTAEPPAAYLIPLLFVVERERERVVWPVDLVCFGWGWSRGSPRALVVAQVGQESTGGRPAETVWNFKPFRYRSKENPVRNGTSAYC